MGMTHVTMVGTGQGYRGPLPPGEVWNLNVKPDPRVLKKLTRSFQIHPYKGRTSSEDRWLSECPVPIYVSSERDRKENLKARVYPWHRVPADAPVSSSFDAMMALALDEGFDAITFEHCDLQVGTPRERLIEHVSLAFWIGVALGKGVTLKIGRGNHILQHPYRYGLHYDKERTWAQRMSFWAALRNLRFDFDDGGAKRGTKGWQTSLSPKKIRVEI